MKNRKTLIIGKQTLNLTLGSLASLEEAEKTLPYRGPILNRANSRLINKIKKRRKIVAQNSSTMQNPGGSKRFKLHSDRCDGDRKTHRYKTSLVSKKSVNLKDKKIVSRLASLSQFGQLSHLMRAKLKSVNERCGNTNLCDIYYETDCSDKDYVQILEEFETYSVMVLEHNFGEEDLFDYDSELIRLIRKSIKSVNKEARIKLVQTQTQKFGRFDLAGKYLSVKKILRLLEKAPKVMPESINDLKFYHYLSSPTMSALLAHLYELSEGTVLTASNKTSAEYVFEFVYRNMKFFKIPFELLEKMVQLHFHYESTKRDSFRRSLKTGIYEGAESQFPGESVKGTFKEFTETRFYGEWVDKKMYHGAIFYRNGDVYKGLFSILYCESQHLLSPNS